MKTANFVLCLMAIAISSATGSPTDDGRMQIPVKQAPYVVRVLNNNGFCTGSLVAPSYVVTAAHCVYGRDIRRLRISANTTSAFDEGITRKVSRMRIHPEFSHKTKYSDIAVLQLTEPIDNIATLPLCEQPLKEDDIVQVFGWGRIAEYSEQPTDLRTVLLRVRPQETCNKEYHRFVKQDMFCASGLDNKNACRGDSGGPAVFKGQLCGVVAFSWNCGVEGSSEAYTNVYAIRSLIQNLMS